VCVCVCDLLRMIYKCMFLSVYECVILQAGCIIQQISIKSSNIMNPKGNIMHLEFTNKSPIVSIMYITAGTI